MYRCYTDYYVSGFVGRNFHSFYAPTLFVALAFSARLTTWSVFHREKVVARSVGVSVVPLFLGDSIRG